MDTEATYTQILQRLDQSPLTGFAFRQEAMKELDKLEGYDWSGIYRLDGDHLILDAYVGAATEHTKIKVGVGVCGTAVATGENQIVSDVRDLDNYLACSLDTRSEAVVLIRNTEGLVIGQIDIDGHKVGRFGTNDEGFLESVAGLIAARWE